MDDAALGRRIRAVRIHLRLRQSDVAQRACVSQDTVSRVERGRLACLQTGTIRAVMDALEMELRLDASWRGGELDRLVDEDHARLVALTVGVLERLGWVTHAEVSYSVYGERGAIDLVAWHEPTRTLLVIEVKTRLVSIEETLRRHDVKVRLGPRIVGERFGWKPIEVARMLVLPDESTPRRQVRRHDGVLMRAYPQRGPAAREWLRRPNAGSGLLLFLSPTLEERRGRGIVRPARVRVQGRGGDTTHQRSGSVGDRVSTTAGAYDAAGP